MNAALFFSKEAYDRLIEVVEKEEIIKALGTPFKTIIRIRGNTYSIKIFTGRYYGSGEYYVCSIIDHNYASNEHIDRCVGGESHRVVVSDGYEKFKESLNEVLRRFPDYTEEEKPLQLSLFDL